MAKIFVRHRRHAGEGTGRPRFAIVAVEGGDLRFYREILRRSELEKIAADTGSEIIYLPRGEQGQEEQEAARRRHHRHEPIGAEE